MYNFLSVDISPLQTSIKFLLDAFYFVCVKLQVCVVLFALQMFVGLECSHRFCHRCWKEYITTKVMDEHIGEVSYQLLHHINQ